MLHHVSAEFVIETKMAALIEQMAVIVGDETGAVVGHYSLTP
jgi:hypothetical protein